MKKNKPNRLSDWELALRDACLNVLCALLVMGQTVIFSVVWFSVYRMNMLYPYYYWGNWVLIFIYAAFYLMFTRLYGGFQVKNSRRLELFYSLTISSVFAEFFTYCIICLLSYSLVNPLPLIFSWGIGILLSLVWVQIAIWLNDHFYPPNRTCIIYDYEDAYNTISGLKRLKWKFNVIESVRLSEGADAVYRAIHMSDCVLLCGISSSARNAILKYCAKENIPIYMCPNISDILISGFERLHLINVPILHYSWNHGSFWYRTISRGIDLVISSLALLIFSPVMLVTALAIRLYDGGPALYKQVRLTEGGKQFKILKFRSMRIDAEKDGIARLAKENDDRITPVGRFIRKYRIDELPQLINIVKGDMAIVGPRPERPEIAAQYEEEIPEFRLRLQVKAGLTGYAQVYGKYNTRPYDKLEMDLMYIANQSILQDIWLMFATVKILFMRESTEGVGEEKTTAGKENILA